MPPASVIAIDGPAGSGKSTIGLALSRRLGYLYFDTGVLYRAVTWFALSHGVDCGDEAALARLAREMDVDLRPPTVDDGRMYTVTLGEQDITWEIRAPRVDDSVSVVAAHPSVRRALLPAQRAIVARGKVVVVGRDIGTVVAPHADLKVYLDASLAVRAERRRHELAAHGQARVDPAQVLAAMKERDRLDSGRSTAPLAKAADAVVLRNEGISVAEAVEELVRLAQSAGER